MTKKKNIIALSPHADDVEISMGGTIVRYVKEGHNVTSLDKTDSADIVADLSNENF